MPPRPLWSRLIVSALALCLGARAQAGGLAVGGLIGFELRRPLTPRLDLAVAPGLDLDSTSTWAIRWAGPTSRRSPRP